MLQTPVDTLHNMHTLKKQNICLLFLQLSDMAKISWDTALSKLFLFPSEKTFGWFSLPTPTFPEQA